MRLSKYVAVLALVSSLAIGASARANLIYNFDTPGSEANNGGHGDGAVAQGWTDTVGQSRSTSVIPATAQGGRASVTPVDQDSQNDRMVFSSPSFFLPVAGAHILTVDLAGGQGNGPDPVANGNLPANLAAVGTGPSGTNPTDVLVLGLRRVSDNAYVSFLQKNQLADAWTGYTWDLTAFANGTTAYKVDQIDSRFGGWGHIEIDNVNIPGIAVPEPASIMLLGAGAAGLLIAARPRRRTA